MKKNLSLCLLCCLVGSLSGLARTLDEANQKFQSGNFAGAAAEYEKILLEEGPSASLYYNLGNSYQRLNRYGPAILAYERARLLAPRDPDLLTNLALARKAAMAFEENRIHPWLDAIIHYLSRNEWSWLLAGSALFLGTLSAVAGAVRLPRSGLMSATAAAGLLLASSVIVLYLRRDEAERGIVLSEGATVRLSPFANAEPLGSPGLGRSVRLGPTNGEFQYIEVPNGNLKGWLDAKDVAAITLHETTSTNDVKKTTK